MALHIGRMGLVQMDTSMLGPCANCYDRGMDFGLKGHAALVTGATRGIGLSIARALAKEGARVSVVARTPDEVERVGTELGGMGVAADLTTGAGRQEAFERTREKFGRVDILVNNLGLRAGTTWRDTALAEFQRAMQGNGYAAAALTSMALPEMVSRRWGRVIVVASIFGLEAGGAPAYNAAKAAEIGYVTSLGASLVGTGVTANAVAPGPILYEGGSWDRRVKEDPAGMADFIRRELPAGRFGRPDEVAAIVTFLCSRQASGLNGTCVTVDGAQSRSHGAVLS